MPPVSVSALLPPSVSVEPLPRLTALLTDRLVFVSSVAAPATFSVPVPSAELLPSTTLLPPFRFVPPE
ncbi:hypothetical protein [Burkholderia cepacia]|uniref:hypothetical protein n=1 Tax=Burkholderia cepacia TaxID=292 RepID=UPI0035C0BA1B